MEPEKDNVEKNGGGGGGSAPLPHEAIALTGELIFHKLILPISKGSL